MSETPSSTGSSGPGRVSATAALLESDDAFLAEERALDVLRLRLVLGVELGLAVAIAWIPIAAALAGEGAIGVRLLGLLVVVSSVAWAWRRASQPRIDDAALARVNFAAFILPTFVVAVLAATTTGIVSPTAHAELVIIAAKRASAATGRSIARRRSRSHAISRARSPRFMQRASFIAT